MKTATKFSKLIIDDIKKMYEQKIKEKRKVKEFCREKDQLALDKELSSLEERLGVDYEDISVGKYKRNMALAKITATLKTAITGGFTPGVRSQLDDLILNKYEKAYLYIGDARWSRDEVNNSPSDLKVGDRIYSTGALNRKLLNKVYIIGATILGAGFFSAESVDSTDKFVGGMLGLLIGSVIAGYCNYTRDGRFEVGVNHKEGYFKRGNEHIFVDSGTVGARLLKSIYDYTKVAKRYISSKIIEAKKQE
ncbi:MAG: hypothetical protein ACP5N1_01250 [Candidatus Woesearchaeota archaeon]